MPHRRARSGLTLLEVAGVLLVALGVSAAAAALFGQARDASRDARTAVAVGEIADTVRVLNAGAGLYGPASAPVSLSDRVVESGGLPPSVRVSDSGVSGGANQKYALFHPYGGHVLVYGQSTGFVVVVDGLDDEECLRVAASASSKAIAGGGAERARVGPASGLGEAGYAARGAIPSALDLADLFDSTVTAGRASAGDGLFLAGPTDGESLGMPPPVEEARAVCSGGRGGNAVSWLFR